MVVEYYVALTRSSCCHVIEGEVFLLLKCGTDA